MANTWPALGKSEEGKTSFNKNKKLQQDQDQAICLDRMGWVESGKRIELKW